MVKWAIWISTQSKPASLVQRAAGEHARDGGYVFCQVFYFLSPAAAGYLKKVDVLEADFHFRIHFADRLTNAFIPEGKRHAHAKVERTA